MNDSLKLGKRAITVAVAAATILWSIGISSFVAPMTARAASAGDVIKGTTLSTVYYYGSDGSRYAFPNEKTYFTWYSDFSDVETISDSALAAIPLAGNIVYRPGTRWIKIQSDPKTYAVSPQGQIRWIESESVASGLAGSDWNTMIDDVPDTFFVDYTVGTSLTDAGDAFNGALVSMGGVTYLVWDGEMREVTSSGFSANRFQTRNLLDGSGIDLAGLDEGSDVTGAEGVLTDSAQLGEEVTGGLSISLASDTPASATVPAGAASVSFVKVKLAATSGSADVSQMVFRLGGVGDVANIENAYLYEGSMRLTDARSVNSTTRQATFSGLNISLDSGDTSYVTVKVDVSDAPTGGDTASFSLVSADSVTSTATVSGSFPISGNTMTFSETEAGIITVDKSGTITDPTIGEEAAEIGEFEVAADGEDGWLEEITVNVDDAADHSNYQLWNGNDLLASGMQDDDLVTFVLTNPLFIEEGNDETLTVSADIGGESGDTIGVAVEEEVDVVAVGGDFGFNMGVDITGYDATGSACDDAGDDCSLSEIQGGELTFAFNGPAADDIQVDGEDQVLMEFTLTAENWVEVQNVGVLVSSDTDDGDDDDGLIQDDGDANLQQITIRESDGTTWMGPEELGDLADGGGGEDEEQAIDFSDDQILQAGESLDLMITADVDSLTPDGEVYFVTLDMDGSDSDGIVAEDANGDELAADDVIPGSDLVGHDFTTTASDLDVELSTPPSSGTYVKGVSNASVVGFSFEAGNTSDVTVTDITYGASLDEDGDGDFSADGDDVEPVGDHVSSCSIYDSESGSLVDGPENVTDADEIEFDDFDWTVEAGETGKLLLKCSFSNTETTDGDDDYAFFIDAADDIQAEDDDGDDVDADLGDNNLDDETVIITIVDMGDLTVSLDGGTANSTIILGASTGVSMSKFKFNADDEDFVVRELTLNNCVGWNEDEDCGDGGEADGSDDIASAVKLSYTNSSGATTTKTGFLSGNSVTFDNLDLHVPTDSTRTLTVTIDTNSVSSTGAASGDMIQLNFDAVEDGTATFEAIGQASGETLDEDLLDDGVAANEMTVRKTKPTISLASGSPSGAGVPGNSEALRFNVAADSRGEVVLEEILFKVVTSDDDNDFNLCEDLGDSENFQFYDLDDPSEKLDDDGDWTFADDGGDDCDAGEVLAWAELDLQGAGAPADAETIGAGETKTYVLKIDTTGASSTDDDAVRVDIPDQDEAEDDTVFDAIRWDDDGLDAEAEADDIDGDLVKNLPVTGGTIQY